jgi:hypothetical protein
MHLATTTTTTKIVSLIPKVQIWKFHNKTLGAVNYTKELILLYLNCVPMYDKYSKYRVIIFCCYVWVVLVANTNISKIKLRSCGQTRVAR